MSSTITNYSSNIDTTFPIPGVDNDTSGFRNNFMNITNGLGVAATEISNLQSSQAGLQTQINDITVVNNNYSQIIASTVTTIVLNTVTSILSTGTFYAASIPTSSVGQPGDQKGMIFATSASVYVCYSNYVSTTTNIWAKVTTVGGTW